MTKSKRTHRLWTFNLCMRSKHCKTKELSRRAKLVDARCLLSDVELKAGVRTIEFECPAELVLLSSYGEWNSMLGDIFAPQDDAIVDKKREEMLFATSRKKFRKYDSIQAALPYLKLDWVKDIRTLNLKPGDFDYNPYEEI